MRTRLIDRNFSRWIPNEKSTWVFQVFQKYNDELEKNLWSYHPVSKKIIKPSKVKRQFGQIQLQSILILMKKETKYLKI